MSVLRARSVHLFFVLLLVSLAVSADAATESDLIPRVWNDAPVRVEIDGPADLERIEELLPGRRPLDVDRPLGDTVRLRVTDAEFERLRDAGFDPVRVEDRERAGRTEAERAWSERMGAGKRALSFPLQTYPSHSEIGALFSDLEAQYPDLVRAYTFGNSVDGRELWGLVISDHPDSNEAEPEVRLASGIHGDETVQMVNLLNLAHELVTSYGQPGAERIDAIVDGTELHVQPLFNPDGYVRGIRYNANWVDLNRNFPEPAGTHGAQEPEVDAFVQYGLSKHFVISLMGHGGALVVNYPWDYTYTRAPDDAAIIELSLEYSTRNLPMYNGAFSQGITNGADWYVITGSLQDWSYDQTDCIDLTLEVSNTKWPSSSTLLDYWDDNRESLLAFVESARAGIHGVVTNAITGEPVDAVISVDGIDKPVSTDPDNGDFYKLLADGTYTVRVDAAGYEPRTFFSVFNTWGVENRLDVALTPVSTAAAPSARVAASIDRVAPNPFNPRTRIEFSLAEPGPASLVALDARGRRVRTLVDASLPAGEHAETWNGDDDSGSTVGAGVYYLQLKAAGTTRTTRVTLVP